MSTKVANAYNAFRRAVRRGVEYLNTNHKGWYNRINTDDLNMEHTERCVCGQLGISEHRIVTPSYGSSELCMDQGLGFYCPVTDPAYRINKKTWIAEIEKLRKQEMNEVFEQSVNGLIDQKLVPSVDKDGNCMYRGLEDRKCAAGHLIPDCDYDPAFEGKAVTIQTNDPEKVVAYFNSKYGKETIRLVNALQCAHDSNLTSKKDKKGWAERCLLTYSEYGIDSPITKAKLETIVTVL